MTRQRSASPGFTLIELMLAVGLLGLLMVMISSSFAAVAHSKTHAESRLNTDQTARNILWQLSKELRGIVQTQFEPSVVLLDGAGRSANGAPIDSITFSTIDVGHRRALFGFTSEETISYAAVPNPQYRNWYILQRTQRSSLLTHGGGPAEIPVVLADDVLGLHLRYFDGARWNETWKSRGAAGGQALPLAIAIDLTMATPGGRPLSYSTMVALPMALTAR